LSFEKYCGIDPWWQERSSGQQLAYRFPSIFNSWHSTISKFKGVTAGTDIYKGDCNVVELASLCVHCFVWGLSLHKKITTIRPKL